MTEQRIAGNGAAEIPSIEELSSLEEFLLQTHPHIEPEWYVFAENHIACSLTNTLVVIADEQGVRGVRLSETEHRIAAILARHSGEVVLSEVMINNVWGNDYFHTKGSGSQNLKTQVGNLRKKLGQPGLGDPDGAIRSQRARGYIAVR